MQQCMLSWRQKDEENNETSHLVTANYSVVIYLWMHTHLHSDIQVAAVAGPVEMHPG